MINYVVYPPAWVEDDTPQEGRFIAVPNPDVLEAVTNLLHEMGHGRVVLTGSAGQVLSDGVLDEETGEVNWRVDPKRNGEVRS